MPYKVVEKNTRWCSNWMMIKGALNYYPREREEYIKFRDEHREYFPRYLKGRIIKAAPGSVGILTFETIMDAKRFVYEYILKNAKIIKVKGIGKPNREVRIALSCGECPMNVLNGADTSAPTGTVAYPKVEVLE